MVMRWKCVCAFDGGPFQGWQSQAGGDGVQDVIERRLREIFRQPVRVHGSSRTDSGVHARRFVFHFDAGWRHSPEALLAAFRTGLPADVLVFSARRVPESFHSRFSAVGKRYTYHVYEGIPMPFEARYRVVSHRKLDTEAMAAAAAGLTGKRDFVAFSAVNRDEKETTVRHLSRLDVVRRGREVRFVVEADGFLYRMARSLAGGLIRVGEGKLSPGRLEELLNERRRTAEIPTAPAHGLFLDRVFYR
jgi:tRNA pseudouridine38-40 synthase